MFFRKKKKQIIHEEKKIINFDFNNKDLDELIFYIKNICGVDLEPKKSVLLKKISIFCENKEIESFKILTSEIKNDKELMQELINLVTINETFFYRELAQLHECIDFVKQTNKKMRILCAPCATGEEVYSLAFLSSLANIDNMDILGIDISSQAISKAKEASYSARSLHRLDDNVVKMYFEKKEERFHVRKDKISNIEFKVVNIFDDECLRLGKFDIIFSRNMMIYFNNEFKQKTIQIFHKLLNENGRLYTGHADLVPESEYFKKIIANRLYYYQKI